ncbi:SDR family NAD(P)-dependent oxidoreductase [Sediminicola luteus]|uniref:Short-chain dehydrogenase n=1 Tax=Sediminicola luteus TaxID=319238 RepID=A0A2A4G737_9FLAO|nr:SDR family oxidoreductase [Sediminicola luteus]PCE63764.1 short-chain dehydrogenase [Sediminicola luteus]
MKNVALITGASSGLGTEFARIHAQNGGDMYIVARRVEKLESLKAELEQQYGVEVRVLAKDLGLPDGPKEIYDQVKQDGVTIDYLINNAGFGGRGKFHERDWDQDRGMIQLNVMALTALTRYFLPHMVERNQGKILNVSSTASFMPGPLQAVYFATKAYVTFFSNALAEELHDTAVTVTNLMPGATETEFASTSGMDKTDLFDKTATALSVAQDGYQGMLRGKLDVVSGLTFSQKLMMGMIPFTPKKIMLKQIRQMQEV